MRYTYTAAWAVVGGGALQEESQLTVPASSESAQFILTRDPDTLLARVDEASALGLLMFMGGYENFQTALASVIEEIKAERNKKIAAKTVLVFQTHGEIDTSVKEPLREFDTFVGCFDAVDKNSVRQLHQTNIETMKVAVAFESDPPSRFAYLTDGIHLLNDSGKPVYSFTPSMNLELFRSTPLSEEATNRIRDRYTALNQANDIDSVYRLFSQMAEYGTDRLKAFLLGWAALEILIAKSFKSYEQQPRLRELFLARIKDVMKDKYRLTDKFIAVTAVLFPSIDDAEAQKNYEDFRKLKNLRNSISHGEAFSEKDLPVHELAALLRKYVVARLNTDARTRGALGQ